MRLMLETLKLQITRYKRDKFGTSCERLAQLGQLELLVEELETGRVQMEAAADVARERLRRTARLRVARPVEGYWLTCL